MEHWMKPETLVGVVAAVVALVALLALLKQKRQPPSRVFKCGRCGSGAAHHNDRTSEAWRNGKTRFFCQACHHASGYSHSRLWRGGAATHGNDSMSTASTGNSGCLGVLALLAVLPLGGLLDLGLYLRLRSLRPAMRVASNQSSGKGLADSADDARDYLQLVPSTQSLPATR